MIFWAALALLALWGGTALWVHYRTPGLVLLLLAGVGVAALRLMALPAWPALAALTLALLLWFFLWLRPRLDRDWAPDVSRIVTGEAQGDLVTLHDIRTFHWTSETEAEPAWRSDSYDLSQITGADLFTSVWGNPKIAHLLLSFAFADGRRLVFSVEIRRERGEVFSSIGGFFRQFELALIAAPEEDILRLRTNLRGEEVRRYPLTLSPAQLRKIFLSYLALGNRLAGQARFYNTLTANCTTIVWQLVRVGAPEFGWHRSVLLSGLLPDWLHRVGLIEDPAKRGHGVRITPLAQSAPEGADYSQVIRPN
ncbi:MAG TPA: DUF4105 domain-containing protein [Gemmobacter sp.]|nr:DUF4105 domain-containing protein [Gemmobacter sp.]